MQHFNRWGYRNLSRPVSANFLYERDLYAYAKIKLVAVEGVLALVLLAVQSVSSNNQSWGGAYSGFVGSGFPWFYRGSSFNASNASPFYAYSSNGYYGTNNGSRAALLALPAVHTPSSID